jgi:alpha-tubulin suppressor-like RCC1 family protein
MLLLAGLLMLVSTAVAAASALATGENHSCALTPSGGVKCWGYNGSGQLGHWQRGEAPRDVEGLTAATSLAAGGNHTCALRSSGAVTCWGDNSRGQLGAGNTNYYGTNRVDVSGISTATAISAGRQHTCARLSDGSLRCWGANDKGQLGDGSTDDRSSPVTVGTITGATAVLAGLEHSCALLTTGGVRCWGGNGMGQLGNGSNGGSATPVVVGTLSDASDLAVGAHHGCALRAAGTVVCWGSNYYGQLGDGGTSDSSVPVAVGGGLSGVAAVGAGAQHSCARLSSGGVRCWGDNDFAQLGNGSKGGGPATSPVAVSGISTADALSLGAVHSCARVSGGLLQCWGDNRYGQLGNGFGANVVLPTNVSVVSAPAMLAGGEYHACALVGTSVRCWGRNLYGQLGDGSNSDSVAAVDTGIGNATAVVNGKGFSCALLSDQSVRCWGENGRGQLGNNSTLDSATPVAVLGLSGVVQLAAGFNHACARLGDATVRCWGENSSGQLGDGNSGSNATTIVTAGISNVLWLAAGELHTCAVQTAGTVQCWGANHDGRLGDGSTSASPTPVTVSGLTAATTPGALALGAEHSCALKSDGQIACWGWDGYSQLGQGSSIGSSATPLAVPDTSNATQVVAGARYTCARINDGSARCWGNDTHGQLGRGDDGSSGPSAEPVQTLSDASVLSGGHYFTCATVAAGAPKCWGLNNYGQVGAGHANYESTPNDVLGSPFQATYSIGGTISGLAAGNSVELQNNGGDTLILSSNGAFTFSTPLQDGSSYAVTVSNQPTSPNQTCTVSQGNGNLAGADVSDIAVACTTNTYTVGGTLSGLGAGKSVLLRNNGGDDLSLNANGSFVFSTALDDGSAYSVSVATAPNGQTCSITQGSGALAGANVSNVQVSCSDATLTYQVTPSAGSHGTISPNVVQVVAPNASVDFTLTPDSGYSASVAGTCPGNLSGNVYSAGPISADCSVEASFVPGTSTALSFATPSRLGQSASFSVQVTGVDSAPADGQVTVTASTSETCSTSSRTANGNVASFECAISFSSAGPRSLSAQFAGSATHADSSSANAPLSVMRFADLSISVDDGRASSIPGARIEYLVEIRNSGPDAAPGTDLASFPTPLLVGPDWSCTVPAGSTAVCPAAGGSGLNTTPRMDLPAGAGLDFLIRGTLADPLGPEAVLDVEARADGNAPNHVHDPQLLNNYATDRNANVRIFADGFEP